MDNITKIWDVAKGKIAIAFITFMLSIGAVSTFTGLTVVDGPDNSVCITTTAPTE